MEDLGAEAAADVRSDHAQPVLGDAQHERAHQQPDHVRVLARGIQRVASARNIVVADGSPRLHRVRDHPVVCQVDLNHVRGRRQRRVHVVLGAKNPVVAEVARSVVVDAVFAGERLLHVDNRRQLLVVDLDQLGGGTRLAKRFRNDDRHLIADMAHLVDYQRRMRRLLHRLAVAAVDLPAARHAADAVGCHVLAGEHGDHARRRSGSRNVDILDPRPRIGRPHNRRMGLPRPVDIRGVGPPSGQEAEILDALDSAAYAVPVRLFSCHCPLLMQRPP